MVYLSQFEHCLPIWSFCCQCGEFLYFSKQNGDRGRGPRGRGCNRRTGHWNNNNFHPEPNIDGKNSDSDNAPPEELAIQKSENPPIGKSN